MAILNHTLVNTFAKTIKTIKLLSSAAGTKQSRMGKERLHCIVSTSGQIMMMTVNAGNCSKTTGGRGIIATTKTGAEVHCVSA